MAAWAKDRGYEAVNPSVVPGENEHLVVHLGNNPYHRWLVPLARRNAVVVLHDFVLHHLLVEMTVAEGDHDTLLGRSELYSRLASLQFAA